MEFKKEEKFSDLKKRTKKFAIDVIKLVEKFPRTRVADVIGRQLLRSATSVGANYRSACRARSQAEFIAKLGICEEESDESMYWMELLIESGISDEKFFDYLPNEANELVSIFVASIKTARKNK